MRPVAAIGALGAIFASLAWLPEPWVYAALGAIGLAVAAVASRPWVTR